MSRLLPWMCCALVLSGCFLDRSPFDDGSPRQGLDAALPVEDGGTTKPDATIPDATIPDAQTDVDASVLVDACVPTLEVCDGVDNDCSLDTIDGSQDPMVGLPCDGDDEDLCEEGILVCTGGALVCVEETPNRDETCNGLDDDCDGRIDEDADCPCTHLIEGGHSYLFCSGGGNARQKWDAARQFCAATGYALVRIDDEAEQRWIHGQMQALSSNRRWWIGAHRQAVGFVWENGVRLDTPGGFTNWKPDEPNNQGGNENCVEIVAQDPGESAIPGGWNDEPCDGDRRWVCEAG